MSANFQSPKGQIEITNDVIAKVVGNATTSNYGVVGMASRNQLRDGIQGILKRENYAKGVVVLNQEGKIVVDVYIIVNYGTKISEIARNVQSSVKYDLDKYLGVNADLVNVFVQDIRDNDA